MAAHTPESHRFSGAEFLNDIEKTCNAIVSQASGFDNDRSSTRRYMLAQKSGFFSFLNRIVRSLNPERHQGVA